MRNLLLIIALLTVFCVVGFAVAYQSQRTQNAAMSTPTSTSANNIPDNMSNPDMPNMSDSMLNVPANGNVKIVIPRLTITNLNGPNIDASDINITNIYDIKSKVENHRRAEITIKNIQVSNTQIPIPINGSFQFSSSLDNVNIEAMQKLMLLSRSMNTKDKTLEQKKQLLDQIMQKLPDIVTNTSNLTVDEAYTTTQGNIISNYKVFYPPDAPLPKDSTELLHQVRGTVLIKVSITLLDSYLAILNSPPPTQTSSNQNQPAQNLFVQQMMGAIVKQNLDRWIKQGYVIKDKTDYIFSLTLDKGIFRVNGKVIDTSQLMPPESATMPTGPGPAMPRATPVTPMTPINLTPPPPSAPVPVKP